MVGLCWLAGLLTHDHPLHPVRSETPPQWRGACAAVVRDATGLRRHNERAVYISSWAAGRHTFEQGLKILEGALAIGRQADAVAPDAVKTRMDLVQGRATSSTSVADSAVFSKIKSWLLATKQTEGTA